MGESLGAGEPRDGRRRFLKLLGLAGAGSATFGRALVAVAGEAAEVNDRMLRQAAWVAGIDFDDAERKQMLSGIRELLADYGRLRAVPLDNGVPPALLFRPAGDAPIDVPATTPPQWVRTAPRPSSDEALAFAGVAELAGLLRTKQISSLELTRLYLERIRRYDGTLASVITLTEDLALSQAARADRELAAGRLRGPLHGIPWGAKDLLAVAGYPTTWGAQPYRTQQFDVTATVAERLEAAGAVLLAKLSLGALAWGDVWFGGTTKNPWNAEQGSSGSSAGPAAATAAGLCGFSIGSETWGSIVSPCTRCGVTGLRPTFGRVSRHGAMALSWSMDKLGPIARTVEDCAWVFDAIQGPDGRDPSVVRRPFVWPASSDPREIPVGFVPELFEEDRTAGLEDDAARRRVAAAQQHDRQVLATLRELGFRLVPIRLPQELPISALSFILTAEASTAFDELTRSGRDAELVRQVDNAWPNVLRQGQMVTAVEYLRANRIRTLLVERLERALEAVPVYVCPSFGGDNLLLTNLTGHPAVVAPNGFVDGSPTSITFNARLHAETELLTVARTWQEATDFHLRRPPLDGIPG